MKNPRVLEIAFGKDTAAFTLAELIETLKRYEQVAIARPLDAAFKCALRVVVTPEMNAQEEVRRIILAMGLPPMTNVAWNDSNERH